MQQLVTIDRKILAIHKLGLPLESNTTQLIFGHGWGQEHKVFLPLVPSLNLIASNLLIDFPGFGSSSHPNAIWGSKEYCDFVASWIKTLPQSKKRVWVGFSFGCRVGLQLAANYPELFDSLFLIAAPGLPAKRPLLKKLVVKTKIYSYKFLKHMLLKSKHDWLKSKFGSYDYKNADKLREILVKVISEDLTSVAKKVRCPVYLVYGENEADVDLEVGRAYQDLIPNANLTILPKYNHHDLLSDGKYKLIQILMGIIRL